MKTAKNPTLQGHCMRSKAEMQAWRKQSIRVRARSQDSTVKDHLMVSKTEPSQISPAQDKKQSEDSNQAIPRGGNQMPPV